MHTPGGANEDKKGVAGAAATAAYFLSAPQPVEVQRANIVIAVAVIIAVTLASLVIAGGFTAETLQRAVILTPVYVLGTWSGSRLFTVAPKEYFRRVALWLLLATGVGVVIL